MKHKTQIIVSHYWNPPRELRSRLDAHKDVYINIGSGSILKELAKTDVWIAANIHFDDVTDKNISQWNYTFCELTNLYWVWKNMSLVIDKDTEYIGLNHYRRLFDLDLLERALQTDDDIDIICANPTGLGFVGWSCGVVGQYYAAHNKEDFDLLEGYIKESFLHKKESYELWKHCTQLFAPCNCVVMKRALFNDWCDRMFPVLIDIYKKIEPTLASRDNYQKRAISFIGERYTSWYVTTQALSFGKNVVQLPIEFKPELKPADAKDQRGVFN